MVINLTKILDIPTMVSFINDPGGTNYTGPLSEDVTGPRQPYCFEIESDNKSFNADAVNGTC